MQEVSETTWRLVEFIAGNAIAEAERILPDTEFASGIRMVAELLLNRAGAPDHSGSVMEIIDKLAALGVPSDVLRPAREWLTTQLRAEQDQ